MRLAIFLLALIPACQGDETLSAYGAAEKTWVLEKIDETPWAARATIEFPNEGMIKGTGPCNGFSAEQTAPYPWFEIGPIRSTRRVCAELQQERTYFLTLSEMTLAEVTGNVLILSNDQGRNMVFRAN